MGNRRTFIREISVLSMGAQMALSCSKKPLSSQSTWKEISDQFFKSEKLNFNTGSAGIMPIPVYKDFVENTRKIASAAPYEVLGKYGAKIENSMQRLSTLVNAPLEGLTIVRNTTEGLNALLWSLPFKEGDEVVYSNLGYTYVKNTLNLLSQTKAIKLKAVNIELSASDSEILESFEQGISSQTKLIIATHITHRMGLIMPVKELCAMAHGHGVELMLDAAHAIGQINHSVEDIGCDYYVSSMHKWLGAPLGSGLLYVKEAHLEKLYPAYSYPSSKQKSIDKFDYTGTIAFQNKMTLSSVLDFHETIGAERKTARLKALSKYLVAGLAKIKGIKIHSDLNRGAGIVTFSVATTNYQQVVDNLNQHYGIHIKKVNSSKTSGLRASLNIHLMEEDVDRLLAAIADL